jgi:SAM-dependent methyltransferase
MPARLEELASLLRCPRCVISAWDVTGRAEDGRIACSACGASYRSEDSVLDLTEADEDPRVALEREGVRHTERDPALGGINDAFDDLSRADGALRNAILALPYGDDSRLYREPGYFANVRASIAAFDFVVRHLDARAGDHLLDLGADLTWSTSQMARRGLRCTAVDINHHLTVGHLFARHYGADYHLVRADMSRVAFRDGLFDIVLAVNALHHGHPIGDVAANIARMLKPGGRLGLIEPYCADEAAKAAFGRAQIDAGIGEQIFFLHEWHEVFSRVGLEVQILRVADSFSAVYRKPVEASQRTGTADARGDLFAGFYRGRLALASAPPAPLAPGQVLELPLLIENRSNATWSTTSQFPVYASYHLYRNQGGNHALVAFDNIRTPLPAELPPGEDAVIVLRVDVPAEPGEYVAEIDLVHEYVSWFGPNGMHAVSAGLSVTNE